MSKPYSYADETDAILRRNRLLDAAPEMLELLREVVTEGYMAELIAHKIVGGLRAREEQECFGKMQALLRDIDG